MGCIERGVAEFSLEKGCALVCFEEAKKRDLVLCEPWVIMGQALVVEL